MSGFLLHTAVSMGSNRHGCHANPGTVRCKSINEFKGSQGTCFPSRKTAQARERRLQHCKAEGPQKTMR